MSPRRNRNAEKSRRKRAVKKKKAKGSPKDRRPIPREKS